MSKAADAGPNSLDLLSTLQKAPKRCAYGAPYIAVIKDGVGTISQGNCNHWDCPRCRWTLAAYHKHRMVEGAKILMETGPLYFWTLTCRGRDLDLETADDNYYLWTNRLLSTCRARAKKLGARWEYVQVTERQKRGAAHSHFIHTYVPDDTEFSTNESGQVEAISRWFLGAVVSAGLGPQSKITQVHNSVGVAAYISGYLEKQISQDVWPPKWKRIRYSRGWPDAAEKAELTKALVKREHWDEIDQLTTEFLAEDRVAYEFARHRMHNIVNPC